MSSDPRHAYARPPFKNQKSVDLPGTLDQMSPKAEHGETSYVGHGRLEGKVVLITGGDSGIGRATSIACAREGATVVLGYLNETDDAEDTRKLAEAASGKAVKVRGDLTDEAACQTLVDAALEVDGRIDVLINNAAYQETRGSLDQMESSLFDRVMKTNLYAPFWMSKAAMPKIPAGGSIINTVSIQGYDPSPMLLPYATTKSALIGMTKAMAGLAIEQGVRVNAVAPGPVWTPLIPATMPMEQVEGFGGSTAFGRPAQPIELAPLYVWLASDQASYVTGEVYGATGGKSPV
jgi:NAD(P)-dependent dehydrogenase (short-subunit alcohol dehydrogenase family)